MAAPHLSPFSGSWYPAGRDELERLLDNLFERSRERTGEWLTPGARAFVVPHAGPVYSGTVAAAAYRALALERPRRVILLGFSHHGGTRGVALPEVEAIETPLGRTEIDTEMVSRLAAAGPFTRVAEDRVCDHSIEIQLPFLQRVAPEARVVPVYVGSIGEHTRQAAAQALADACTEDTVLLASSDLTHYGRNFGYQPFPADQDIRWRLRELDFESMEAAGSLDADLFRRSLAESGDTVCGVAPISLLLETLARMGGGLYQETLDYQTSGEITGDYAHSVSYGALGYYPAASFAVGAEDRDALLASARTTLERLRRTKQRQAVPASGGTPALEARRGLFVSLHSGGELLGCVGTKDGREPLRTEVAAFTLAAALDDPRFKPAARRSGQIDLEISILTPMRRLSRPEQFQIGRHGAFLALGERRGLLLPQVAQGRGWERKDFLRALARKSGLDPEAWHDARARLYCFEAQVFSDAPGQSGG